MTAIVGIAQGGRVWMGADGCVSYGNDERAATSSSKIWRAGASGGWLIGAAGAGGWTAILRAVKWPKAADPEWPEAWLPGALLQAADSLGLELPCSDENAGEYGDALVGGGGGLWRVDCGLDVSRYDEAAAGSGSVAARAVLHVTGGAPRSRIRRALEAAAAIVPGVSPPFSIDSVP